MNVKDQVKLIAFCEGLTGKYKRTGTSTRYCQAAVALDDGLTERRVGCLIICLATVVLMAMTRSSMPLEAA